MTQTVEELKQTQTTKTGNEYWPECPYDDVTHWIGVIK